MSILFTLGWLFSTIVMLVSVIDPKFAIFPFAKRSRKNAFITWFIIGLVCFIGPNGISDTSIEKSENTKEEVVSSQNEKNEIEEVKNEVIEKEEVAEIKMPDRRVFWSDNNAGYIDQNENVVIKPTFKVAYPFDGNYAIVAAEGEWLGYSDYGLIDRSGTIIISLNYDSLWRLDESSYIAVKEDKEYLISVEGKILSEGEVGNLSNIDTFSEGYAITYIDGNYGVIDDDGIVYLKVKYDYISNFKEGLARVSYLGKDKYGIEEVNVYEYINKNGDTVIGPFRYIGKFYDGIAMYKKDKLYGFIDREGNEIIKAKYEDVYDFSEGIAFVDIDGDLDYGGINLAGEEVFPEIFSEHSYFKEGLANTKNEYGTSIIIDKHGDTVFKSEKVLTWFGQYSDGLATIEHGKLLETKWGYMDKRGKVVIPMDFDYAEPFEFGIAKVQIGEKVFSINLEGDRVGY